MFEQTLTPWQRALRALREFLDLSACRVLTVRQQIAFALVCAALGAAGAVVAAAHQLERIAPVAVFSGEIERFQPDYSVYRLRFQWRGHEISSCHIVIYGDRKWAVKC